MDFICTVLEQIPPRRQGMTTHAFIHIHGYVYVYVYTCKYVYINTHSPWYKQLYGRSQASLCELDWRDNQKAVLLVIFPFLTLPELRFWELEKTQSISNKIFP